MRNLSEIRSHDDNFIQYIPPQLAQQQGGRQNVPTQPPQLQQPQPQPYQPVRNEQGEYTDKRVMSLNHLLNDETMSNSDHDSHDGSTGQDHNVDIESLKEEPIDYEVSPPTTPYSNASPTGTSSINRAICSVCKTETGRCHASDPSTMQSFFANSLHFDGVLSTSDWLCMKCYSKWYNRCKRKATSSSVISEIGMGVQPVKRQRRKEKDGSSTKKERDHKFIHAADIQDKDSENDDALLLARIGTHHYSPACVSPASVPTNGYFEEVRDVESEVDILREEVFRLKSEVTRLANELVRRDEQMDSMFKFFKIEMSGMHELLKDIAVSRAQSVHSNPMLAPVITSRVEG